LKRSCRASSRQIESASAYSLPVLYHTLCMHDGQSSWSVDTMQANIFMHAAVCMYDCMQAVQRLTVPRAGSVTRCLKKVVLKMGCFQPNARFYQHHHHQSPIPPTSTSIITHPLAFYYRNSLIDSSQGTPETCSRWSESSMSLINPILRPSSRQRPTTRNTRLSLGMRIQ